MDMFSNWWGGKPAKESTENKNDLATQVEESCDSGKVDEKDGDNVAVKSEAAQQNISTNTAAAAAPAASSGGDGECDAAASAESTPAASTSDTTVSASDEKSYDGKQQRDGTFQEDGSKRTPFDIGNMTKEDAAVAAEAALNSAYNFGSFLFKKVSDTATKTATMIQKTVEEKTIVGEFQKEQVKFVQEKHSKRKDAAVPPWVGYNEEEQMKEQILALSQDKRNFMRNPPAGVQFHFDYNSIHPVAMATLQEDPNLQKMRFELVPKMIQEENFWRNYFYRVSLIKQSSQLTSLSKSGEERKGSGSASHSSDEGSSHSQKGDKTPPIDVKGAPSGASQPGKSGNEDEQLMEPPDSPPGSEFISDAFTSELDEADLKEGMEQLGMDKKAEDGAEEEVPEWEKELQQELQDYEVVADEPNEEWEREINQMLEDEVDIN